MSVPVLFRMSALSAATFFQSRLLSVIVSSRLKKYCVRERELFHSISVAKFALAPGWGSKLSARKKLKRSELYVMDPKSEEILAPLRASVKEQVRHA